jgi:hypothetical protein
MDASEEYGYSGLGDKSEFHDVGYCSWMDGETRLEAKDEE